VLGVGTWLGLSIYKNTQSQQLASPAQRVIDDLASSVRKFPNSAPLRVRLGEAYASAGLTKQGIEQFNVALKLDPKHTGALLDLGLLAMQQKDYRTAENYMKKVEKLTATGMAATSPQRENALFNLGIALLQQKQYEDAASYFKESLRIRRDASDTYYHLALALRGMGDDEAALDELNIALQFDPRYAQAHYQSGLIYKDQGKMDLAAQHIAAAVEIAPKVKEPKASLASFGGADEWLEKSRDAATEGDAEKAAMNARVAVALDPTFTEAHKVLAQVLEQQGKKKAALNAYKETAKLDPKDVEVAAAVKRLSADTKKKK